MTTTAITTVADAAKTVPERHYTHHGGRGPTDMRSNPVVIHRELDTLAVDQGMSVLEIGTGSGYSGGLLAALVGDGGRVASVDIDPYLVRWGRVIHQELGVSTVQCAVADGTAGFAAAAPYHRIVAWCTPPVLPDAWCDQLIDDGRIVTPLPIAALPGMTVVAAIRMESGIPRVENIRHGGYMPTTTTPGDPDTPVRWVDWEYRDDQPAWISIAWRGRDDDLHSGARAALDLLRKADRHIETYPGGDLDWSSLRTWAAATGDTHLTTAEITRHQPALGHTTPEAAAVIQADGRIIADRPDSPSLIALHSCLEGWEQAGRPAPESYAAHLEKQATGWNLHLSRTF